MVEMDMHRPLTMTDERMAAVRPVTSRFSTQMHYHQTPTSMESPSLKSQPAPIHWSVGWADLMMTMFILFLVMYLYQSAQKRQITEHGLSSPLAKTVQQGPSVRKDRMPQQDVTFGNRSQNEMKRQTAEVHKPETNHPDHNQTEMTRLYDLAILTLRDKDLKKFADIELSPDRTIRIVLAADLLFPSGNADLGPTARENIQKIAHLLKKTPHTINVVGHTDNVPIKSGPFTTNWELSVMRATTVARFLIEEMGIAAPQLSVTGYSFYKPQANNETPANRAKNRRVEIIISREQQPTIPTTNNPSLL